MPIPPKPMFATEKKADTWAARIDKAVQNQSRKLGLTKQVARLEKQGGPYG